MKILWSFNTKLDEHELYDAIQKNGEWNAIMMKKHWVFLVRPMIRMIFAFMAFWLLIWFAYKQFYTDYVRIFRILTVAYSWVTLIRCIHSLRMIMYDIRSQSSAKDWYIDTIDKNSFKEGKYERFLRHSFISMGLQVFLMIANCIVSFVVQSTSNILFNIVWVVVNIWFLFLLYKVLDRIIDYEMDFNIFTVDQFILYRQHWFFRTESLNIATSTIKIVQESKSWFWWSLFNFWKVSIHPEWNLWWNTKAIELFYVPYPKKLTKKLNEFIEKSKELMNVNIAA
jgi:hypothetical protein